MRQSPTWAMRRRGPEPGDDDDEEEEDDDEGEEEVEVLGGAERRSARSAVDDPSVPSARHNSSVRSYARWRTSTGSISTYPGLAGRSGASTADGVSSVGVGVLFAVEEAVEGEDDDDDDDDDVGGNCWG